MDAGEAEEKLSSVVSPTAGKVKGITSCKHPALRFQLQSEAEQERLTVCFLAATVCNLLTM